MRIVFPGTEGAPLAGGMIMTILLVDALRQLGHDARALGPDRLPDWMPAEIPLDSGVPSPRTLRDADAVVTGSSGIETALEAGVGVVAHLCTGYEPHLWPTVRERFEAIYRLPTLKLVIAPHLQRTLRRELGLDSVVVGSPIELSWFSPPPPRTASGPMRVLVVGPEPNGPAAPVPFKGIATALEVVRRARRRGAEIELVRLTPREDSLLDSELVDEAHVAVPPREVPEIYRSCDVYLGASTPAEGLGMPAFEAACSGLALVLPAIPSYLDVPELHEAALLYEPGDADAALGGLERLLADRELLERLRAAGPTLDLASRFSPIAVGRRVATALEAARGG